MSLVVSRVWQYMTPDFIYNEMTSAELTDALDYINMYEMDERRYAFKPYHRNKKLFDWWKRKEANPSKDYEKLKRDLKHA